MSYKIKLQPSGHQFETIGNETILDAAFRSGINLAYSCQNGSCGDCRAKIISGEVERINHHDFTMSEAEKLQNTVLMCCYKAVSDCTIEANEAKSAADIPKQQIKVKVAKIETVADDYVVLHLRTPRTKVLRFLAGQKIRISGEGIASFTASIASCPCNGMILHLHLYKQNSHPFVQYVFNEMKSGQALLIEGPAGDFILDEESQRPIVMVAVNTGFASLKSIIEHAIALDLQQAIHLYWLVTENHQHYHDNFCRSWEYALETFMYQPMCLAPDDDGLNKAITEIISRSPVETELDMYLCGPENMVKSIRTAFVEKGTPEQRIVEEFTDNSD